MKSKDKTTGRSNWKAYEEDPTTSKRTCIVSATEEAAYGSELDLLYFESVLSTTTHRTRISN